MTLSILGGAAFAQGLPHLGGGAEPPQVHESAGVEQPAHRPGVVYVTDFYVDADQLQRKTLLGREGPLRRKLAELRGDDPATRADKLVRVLAQTIAGELAEAGQASEHLPSVDAQGRKAGTPGRALPPQGWLVDGWLVSVDEGNRALSSAVGFGLGAESVEIQVSVSDLARDAAQPFLVMGSATAAKRRPGGLILGNPYAVAAKYLLSRGATEADVKRQGKAIAKGLMEYLESKPGRSVPP